MHDPFYRYSPKERAQIRRYALEHGMAAATKKFSRKLDVELSETTVRSIRDGYLEEVKLLRQTGETEQLWKIPERQRGRALLWVTA